MKDGRVGIAGDGSLDQGDGLVWLAALQSEHAEQMQRFRIVRMLRQQRAIDSFGRSPLAAAMVGDGFRQRWRRWG